MIGWYDEGPWLDLEKLVETILGQFHAKLEGEPTSDLKKLAGRISGTHEGSGVGGESPGHSGSKTSPQGFHAIGGDCLPHTIQKARVSARSR